MNQPNLRFFGQLLSILMMGLGIIWLAKFNPPLALFLLGLVGYYASEYVE